MCGIVCPIQDITSSINDLKPPCLCHHTHYIWHRVHCVWMCHHIHCIDDITPTVFLRSHPLKFTKSYPVYMTWQPLDLCHNSHSFNDITPFIGMIAHPLYVQYHITYIRHHTHILWDHTTFCVTSHALFLDITPSISDTTSTLSVSSRPVHQLYHTNSLYDIKHTLCKTSQSVCMTSHKHFMTSNPYRYDITHSVFMTW